MAILDTLITYTSAFYRPIRTLSISAFFLLVTILRLFLTLNFRPFISWSLFQQHWFSNFWAFHGPRSAACDAPQVSRILGQAYGTVLDLGPGSGFQLHHFDRFNITKIYGVEPCIDMHPALRKRIAEAGLQDVYQILPFGAGELSGHLKEESIDTIASCKVFCAISQPKETMKTLYPMLKTGGQVVMWEHVRQRGNWVLGWAQKVLMVLWPHMLQGCSLDRDTVEWWLEVGKWEKVEVELIEGSEKSVVPFVRGNLVK